MPALLAFLPYLPSIMSLVPTIGSWAQSLIKWIGAIRTVAQQAGVWTPELEAGFVAMLWARAIAPEWQPDPPTAVTPVTPAP